MPAVGTAGATTQTSSEDNVVAPQQEEAQVPLETEMSLKVGSKVVLKVCLA